MPTGAVMRMRNAMIPALAWVVVGRHRSGTRRVEKTTGRVISGGRGRVIESCDTVGEWRMRREWCRDGRRSAQTQGVALGWR